MTIFKLNIEKVFLLILTLAVEICAYAQNNITLIVTGEGPTKNAATTVALRSAIEQAYGTFVSSDMQILNDDVVKDEVATISSGNIIRYSEISSSHDKSGWLVNIEAEVSINNLQNYAKSHGGSTEFAGQVWSMNLKMRKLNAENEKMALTHLLEQLDMVVENGGLFDIAVETDGNPYKLNVEEYPGCYGLYLTLKYNATPNSKSFYNCLVGTLNALSLSSDEINSYAQRKEEFYKISLIEDLKQESGGTFADWCTTKNAQTYYLRNNPVEFFEKLFAIISKGLYRYQIRLDGITMTYQILGLPEDPRVGYVSDRNYYARNNHDKYTSMYTWKKITLATDYPKSNMSANSVSVYSMLPNVRQMDGFWLGIFLNDKTKLLNKIDNDSYEYTTQLKNASVVEIDHLFEYSNVGKNIFEYSFVFPFTEDQLSSCTGFSIIQLFKGADSSATTQGNNVHSENYSMQEKVYSCAYDGYINLRELPTMKSNKVGQLMNGPEGAELLEKTNKNWWKIKVGRVVGYASRAYLQLTPTEKVDMDLVKKWFSAESEFYSNENVLLFKTNGTFQLQTGKGEGYAVIQNGKWHIENSTVVLVCPDGSTTRLDADLSSETLGIYSRTPKAGKQLP